MQRVGMLALGGLASGFLGPECLQAAEIPPPRLPQFLAATLLDPAQVDPVAGAEGGFDATPAKADEGFPEGGRAWLPAFRPRCSRPASFSRWRVPQPIDATEPNIGSALRKPCTIALYRRSEFPAHTAPA